MVFIEIHQCLDDTPRFLGRRGVIKIYKPMAVDLAGQDGKFGGDGLYVQNVCLIKFDI